MGEADGAPVAARAGLILAAALALGHLGPLEPAAAAIGIAVGAGVWAATLARDAQGRAARVVSWAAVLVGVPILSGPLDARARLAALVGIALAGRRTRERTAAAIFCSGALAWRIVQEVPEVGEGWIGLSRWLCRSVGVATGQRIDLGPSVSGLDLLMLFVLAGLAWRRGGSGRTWRPQIAGVVLLAGYIAVLPWIGSTDTPSWLNLVNNHPEADAGRAARTMCRAAGLLFLALGVVMTPRGAACAAGAPRGTTRARWRAAAAIAAAGTATALLPAAGTFSAPPRRAGEILVLESDAFDLDVPGPDGVGIASAGMFGLLPAYLALDGHRLRTTRRPVTAEALARTTILVVVLPVERFSDREKEIVGEFVRAGGTLLAMGDHTDLLGTMEPIGDLLAPWHLSLRFDSAYPAVRGWRGCLAGPLVPARKRTGIGTGASIRAGGGARPLVVGRHGLSDAGDRSNGGVGANLGDYAYTPGERLGDLVLAAEARDGTGRVVLFGDTSSFQNVALPFSYPFVADLMDDLSRPAPAARGRDATTGAALGAAALGVTALAGSVPAAAALATAAVVPLTLAALSGRSPAIERVAGGSRIAWVDAAHLNDVALDLWEEESLGGLIVNLQRAGWLPIVRDVPFDLPPPDPASLVVMPAPRRPPSPAEARALARHVDSGGTVLVAGSGPEARAAAPLIEKHGLEIGAMPLGPVPVRGSLDLSSLLESMRHPQFRDAWPVRSPSSDRGRSYYEAFGHDLVVEVRADKGAGRVVVIGDPDFLTDRVLEGERTAWAGNVALLKRILTEEAAR